MKVRQLDKNWDYLFGRGTHAYLEGAEAVAQTIKSRLLLLYGEWWENLTDGLPLWQNIIGSRGTPENLKTVDYLFKDRILGTQDVVSILAYKSKFKDRVYTFTAAVSTKYGDIVITNDMTSKPAKSEERIV